MIGPFGKSPKVSHHARAVVTGAGSGIGAAFAIELARRGSRVVCSDIDEVAAKRTVSAIADIGGSSDLTTGGSWLKASLDARNPYIDPLNLMQIEFLQRRRALPDGAAEHESLRDLLRLTVQGIASGMRTTARPKGHSTNAARRKHAIPNGMVMISTHNNTPRKR